MRRIGKIAVLPALVAAAVLAQAEQASAQTATECRNPAVRLTVTVVGAGGVTAQEPAADCLNPAGGTSWNVLRLCGFHCLHFHTGPEAASVRLSPSSGNLVGWSANCTPRLTQPQNHCTVLMDAAKTVTAQFADAPDASPPSRPSATAVPGGYHVTLTWSAAGDDRWLGGYDIVQGGNVLARVPAGTTTVKVENLFCEQAYTFAVVAFDTVNRTASADVTTRTGSCIGRADTTAPNTIFHVKPRRVTRSRTAYFHWGATEGRVRYACRLDRGRWGACRPGKRYRKLAKGVHTFRVRATDAAGNRERAPAVWRWRIR